VAFKKICGLWSPRKESKIVLTGKVVASAKSDYDLTVSQLAEWLANQQGDVNIVMFKNDKKHENAPDYNLCFSIEDGKSGEKKSAFIKPEISDEELPF